MRMEPLVRIALLVQGVLHRALGFAVSLGGAAVLVGYLTGAVGPGLGLVALTLVLASSAHRIRCLWRGVGVRTPGRVLVEAELMTHGFLLAFWGIASLPGGLNGAFMALVYLLTMALATFGRPMAAAIAVAYAVALDVGLRWIFLGASDGWSLGIHAAMLPAFATLNGLFVRVEIERVRRVSKTQVSGELSRIREAARSYRLLESTEGGRELTSADREERLLRSGVDEIQSAQRLALELLGDALGARTVALLWLEGEVFQLEQVVSTERALAEGPYPAREGILSAVLAQGRPVLLDGPRCRRLVPYAVDGSGGASLAAVPILEGDSPRGVILADREDARPFVARETQLLENAARFIMKSVENERVFAQLERSRVEQGNLYRAVGELSGASTEADVIQLGVDNARAFAAFDFVVVTLFSPDAGRHEICAVSGEGSERLVGKTFAHNTGLVSVASANGQVLPYKGAFDRRKQRLFAEELDAPALRSVVVIPLMVRERALGTLVLGSYRARAFPDDVRPILEVLASHIAVSLSGARMMRTLEDLATIDGLTGLLNKRTLTEVGEQKVRSALRFERSLSVIICDLDHFKTVNDTHGHDVGDRVLRGLGEILQRSKRATDAVGRFGGEEFVIVCEETDSDGAQLLAERVRRELESVVFPAKQTELSVTCSIGIATCPESGDTWTDLFKAADEALYASKRGGRNRTTVWSRACRAA